MPVRVLPNVCVDLKADSTVLQRSLQILIIVFSFEVVLCPLTLERTRIQAFSLTNHVISGKVINFSEPQFPHLESAKCNSLCILAEGSLSPEIS